MNGIAEAPPDRLDMLISEQNTRVTANFDYCAHGMPVFRHVMRAIIRLGVIEWVVILQSGLLYAPDDPLRPQAATPYATIAHMIRVFLITYFTAPLLCWLLLARTKILGWINATLLVVIAVIAGLMISSWTFGEQNPRQAWTIMGATTILLLAGTISDRLETRKLRLPASRRGRIGMWLAIGYCASMLPLKFLDQSRLPAPKTPALELAR